MMVDSGLTGSLKPAPAGGPIASGSPAPTGIAALFSALMSGVASPSAPGSGQNGPLPLSPDAPAIAGEGADNSAPLAIEPDTADTPSLALEMTTYLDQIGKTIEPVRKKEAASTLPVTVQPSVAKDAAGDVPDGTSPGMDQLDDTQSQGGADMPTLAVATPSAPIASPLIPSETLRSAPPADGAAPSPIAKPTTATAVAAGTPNADEPASQADLAAAIAAFTQQQGMASKPAGMGKPTQPSASQFAVPKSDTAATPPSPASTTTDNVPTDSATQVQSPATPSATPLATQTSAQPFAAGAAQPVADIGGMLGQQVIDMGSGGQWIDGLAREIAALSKGEGQGSFRLSPEHLGPMRVEIRAGDQGANVTLTVETKAAEAMLVQDRHLLKADAQLSALRIGEVTVERVTHIAEPGRSDSATGQGTSGQQGNNAQNAALAQGQSQGQSQNNGQLAANRKVPDAATVSSEAEPRETGGSAPADATRRARYA